MALSVAHTTRPAAKRQGSGCRHSFQALRISGTAFQALRNRTAGGELADTFNFSPRGAHSADSRRPGVSTDLRLLLSACPAVPGWVARESAAGIGEVGGVLILRTTLEA